MAERTIWKYPLRLESHPQEHRMPEGSNILYVGAGPRNELALWVEVSPEATKKPRDFAVRGTGHPIPFGRHIGTAVMPPFVWHVYEVTRRPDSAESPTS